MVLDQHQWSLDPLLRRQSPTEKLTFPILIQIEFINHSLQVLVIYNFSDFLGNSFQISKGNLQKITQVRSHYITQWCKRADQYCKHNLMYAYVESRQHYQVLISIFWSKRLLTHLSCIVIIKQFECLFDFFDRISVKDAFSHDCVEVIEPNQAYGLGRIGAS